MLEPYYIYHYQHVEEEAVGIIILNEKMRADNNPQEILEGCCNWEFVRSYRMGDNIGPMHELPLGIFLTGVIE